MQNTNQAIKIQAVAYWFSFLEKNEMSDKYQVDVSQLSETQVDRLEGLGINVKNKGDDRGYFVTAKSTNRAPRVEDTEGFALTEPVGNGSKVTFIIKPYDYNFKGKTGVGVGLSKARVDDLVVFNKEDAGFDDVPEL
jgi:hypothetical protein|tara:strand:+ start:67 stop:477 length:411 start_codon:yes stop_codon:yes gene_type:complete